MMIPTLTKCPSCNGMGIVEWTSPAYPYNERVDDCTDCHEGLVPVGQPAPTKRGSKA